VLADILRSKDAQEMFGKTPKTASVPLSEYTNRELRRGAAELRQVAATASTDACKQALETLGAHFDALVEQREAEDHEAYRAAVAFALRLTGAEQSEAEKHTAMLGPDRMSQPPFSRQALQFATDAICRQNVLSETRQHPVIQNASLKLVHLLTAYDLLPAEQTFGKARSDIPEKRRNEGNFDGAHPTGHHILVVDDVADVLVTVGAFLTNAGFTVQKASNGDEALRLIGPLWGRSDRAGDAASSEPQVAIDHRLPERRRAGGTAALHHNTHEAVPPFGPSRRGKVLARRVVADSERDN
jgi:hypothetical protein